MNYLRPERLSALARDYALGTLHGGARRRFSSLLAHSLVARIAVEVWQQRLAALEGATPPIAPPPGNWPAIQRHLFPEDIHRDDVPAGRWRRLIPSEARGAAVLSTWALASAVAGALACFMTLRGSPAWMEAMQVDQATPASYVGMLHDSRGQPALVANSRRHGKLLTVRMLQPLSVPKGQAARLWALPDHGAPIPLATLPGKGTTQAELSDTSEALFRTVRRLAVSIEAADLTPSSPQTPFVWEGDCAKVW